MPKMSKNTSVYNCGQVLGIAISAFFWVGAVIALGAIGRVLYEVGRLGWTGFYYF